MNNASASALMRRIESKEALVGVIGLGYVGLPLALAFAERGLGVLGFDVDEAKTEALGAGRSYIDDIESSRLAAVVETGTLKATAELSRLGEPDVLLICVPTPLTRHREPDLSYVTSTTQAIARQLRTGQLVILESTTYPGTTEEVLVPLLEDSGLTLNDDFFVAYSPEREDPGNPDFSTTSIPKVVGGVGEDSSELAEALYAHVLPQAVRVSSPAAAEATKLTENIFRAVNIALVNELKVVFDAMGIDVREVLDAAATKPFGFMKFEPGPGWGGHCIPIDPFYLAWKAREYDRETRFIELAGTVNVEMPLYVLQKLATALNEQEKPVKGSKVLILGLAYKKNVSDPRESPAFEILDRLLELGAEPSYHDPHVPVAPSMRSWPELPTLLSQPLTPELLAEQDAVVIVTDHDRVDYDLVLEHAPLIVDTRGIYRSPAPNVIRA